jgi:hypothetical protein
VKLYFAGSFDPCVRQNHDFGIKRHLVSYAELKSWQSFNRWKKFFVTPERKDFEHFLDSGAFSAYYAGVKIGLVEYIDFCQKNGKYFNLIANLDVMFDAEASYNNFLDMERAGIHALPAWHHGEPLSWLEKYCRQTDYVALGGIAKMSRYTDQLISIISRALSHIPKGVKVHLFGITSVFILKKFGAQVESVDSTSWLAAKRFAMMYRRNGQSISYGGRNVNDLQTDAFLEYNARRFLEVEEDINSSIQFVNA